MREAVIVAACRTPVGRAPRGALRLTRPEYMGSTVLNEALKRTPGLDPMDIDDVIIGCTFPEGEQGLNLGRVVAQKAGLPDEVPGQTVNRFCCSGIQSISHACERIMVGAADVILAGGVESMSLIPMGGNSMSVDPQVASDRPWAYEGMGMTAENVARDFNISREDQDDFAAESWAKANKAVADGVFKDEIVPLTIQKQRPNGKGGFEIYDEIFDTDEGPRPTSRETLAKLRPAFTPKGGSVTAGNSSQMSDGAAMVVCMSKEKAKALGLNAPAHLPLLPGGRRGPALHGHRPGGRHPQGPEAGRHHHGRPEPDRTERGLRVPGPVLHPRAEHQHRDHQRARRGHRPGTPPGLHRSQADHPARL